MTRLQPMALTADRGVTLVRGEGALVWDSDGREYVDCMSGYGTALLGHRHPGVDAALHAQVDRIIAAHQSVGTEARAEFLEALDAVLPGPLSRVCFANSGAETLEAALKFARAATGRQTVIATHRAYHGRTYGALSLTAEQRYREPFGEMLPGAVHVPFGDADAVAERMDGSVAAVVVEPIQGEAGVRIPSAGYLRALRELCDAHGALLVHDEVQTAFRTGAVLAADHDGVVPDILCLAKGIANGVPLGVTVTTEAVAEHIPRGSHGSTFAANPLACAAGAATLRVVADADLHRRVESAGSAFAAALRGLDHGAIREVRGRGLMVAVEMRRPATPALRALQENGVLALPAGQNVIRFLPPILIGPDVLARVIGALDRVLTRA